MVEPPKPSLNCLLRFSWTQLMIIWWSRQLFGDGISLWCPFSRNAPVENTSHLSWSYLQDVPCLRHQRADRQRKLLSIPGQQFIWMVSITCPSGCFLWKEHRDRNMWWYLFDGLTKEFLLCLHYCNCRWNHEPDWNVRRSFQIGLRPQTSLDLVWHGPGWFE